MRSFGAWVSFCSVYVTSGNKIIKITSRFSSSSHRDEYFNLEMSYMLGGEVG